MLIRLWMTSSTEEILPPKGFDPINKSHSITLKITYNYSCFWKSIVPLHCVTDSSNPLVSIYLFIDFNMSPAA